MPRDSAPPAAAALPGADPGPPLGLFARLLDPRPARVFTRQGDAARDRRDWAGAAAAYAEALRRAPRRAAVWVQLGHVRKEAGDLAGAEHAYRRALALRPAEADTLLHLGHLLARQDRMAEAARLLARGLDAAPHLPPLVREAGRTLRRRLGQIEAALVARLDAAIEAEGTQAALADDLARRLGTERPAVARFIARRLERGGEVEEAERILAEALRRDPHDPETQRALASLKAHRNAEARARIAAARGVAADALPRSLRFVAFGTTGICNASCIHCPTGKAETSHVPRVTMPMPLFERIVGEMAELHLSVRMQVSLGLFGDGLVDPLVVRRVQLLRRMLPGAMVSVNTNGAAYDPAKHRAMFEDVGIVSVHCESLRPEVYDRLMAPLRLKNVRPKIEAILRDFPGKVHVSIPVSRLNRDELPEMRSWFAARGAVTVAFDGLSSRCATDRTLFDSLALAPEPVRCRPEEVEEDLIVDCDGLVTICCQDFRREEPIGDLSRQSLVETLLSPERAALRAQFAEWRHAERRTCRRCYGDPRITVD